MSETPPSITIGLLGCGTVGTGILELIRRRQWHEYWVRVNRAFVRDPARPRLLPVPVECTDRVEQIVTDPDIDVVIDVLPDPGTAYGPVRQALENRKHVISANWQLLATHGDELEQFAREQGVAFLYEAAMTGSVPFAHIAQRWTRVSPIRAFLGIPHGVERLWGLPESRSDDGASESEQMMRFGIAPSARTEHEWERSVAWVILIGRWAAGTWISREHIRIRKNTPKDHRVIELARAHGYALCPAFLWEDHTTWQRALVEWMAVPDRCPLAHLSPYEAGLLVWYEDIGPQLYTGLGGGALPAAAAVLADLLRIVQRDWSFTRALSWHPHRDDQAQDAYFLVLHVAHQSDNIHACVTHLQDHAISVQHVHVNTHPASPGFEIVIVTERVPDATMRTVVHSLEKHPGVHTVDAFRIPDILTWSPERVYHKQWTPAEIAHAVSSG